MHGVSRITSDILGMMGQRSLDASHRAMNTALERLATGKRINRASDDPSGMVAAGNLSVQAKRAQREIASLERTNKRIDATEGGLGVVSDLLVELQGLVVSAADPDTKDKAEREALQVQAGSIIEAINYVSTATIYDGEQVLRASNSASLGNVKWNEWLDVPQTPKPEKEDGESPQAFSERLSAWHLSQIPRGVQHTLSLADLGEGKSLNLLNGDLETAQKVVKSAIDGVAAHRAMLGADSNSNSSRIRALSAEFENTMAAKSTIEDADFAHEMSALVRSQILEQASIKSILIGRQQATAALGLL